MRHDLEQLPHQHGGQSKERPSAPLNPASVGGGRRSRTFSGGENSRDYEQGVPTQRSLRQHPRQHNLKSMHGKQTEPLLRVSLSPINGEAQPMPYDIVEVPSQDDSPIEDSPSWSSQEKIVPLYDTLPPSGRRSRTFSGGESNLNHDEVVTFDALPPSGRRSRTFSGEMNSSHDDVFTFGQRNSEQQPGRRGTESSHLEQTEPLLQRLPSPVNLPKPRPRSRANSGEGLPPVAPPKIRPDSRVKPGHRRSNSEGKMKAMPLLQAKSFSEYSPGYGAIAPSVPQSSRAGPGHRRSNSRGKVPPQTLLRSSSVGDFQQQQYRRKGHRRVSSGEGIPKPKHRRAKSEGKGMTALLNTALSGAEFGSGYGAIASSSQQNSRVPGHRRSKSREQPATPLLESLVEPLSSGAGDFGQNSRRKGHSRTSSIDSMILSPVSEDKDDSFLGAGLGRPHSPSYHRLSSFPFDAVGTTARPPLRARTESDLSVASVRSLSSVGSVVSNIAKSSLFKGVTEAGVIRLHLPIDNIQLVMDPDLESGTIYKDQMSDEEDKFEQYHCCTEEDSLLEEDDMFGGVGLACNCACDVCHGCTEKARLPDPCYKVTVDSDLYKRVLKEVSDSRKMPCGLFYCGHHEDVSRPSIHIAIGIVVLLFLAMFVVAVLPSS